MNQSITPSERSSLTIPVRAYFLFPPPNPLFIILAPYDPFDLFESSCNTSGLTLKMTIYTGREETYSEIIFILILLAPVSSTPQS